MTEDILKRIKDYRNKKGYSYEYMEHQLNTSPTAYGKIENNKTRLTVERLFEIATVLDTKVLDILGVSSNSQLNQTNNNSSTGHQTNGENSIGQNIENYFQENKEKTEKIEVLYEARLKDKDVLIAELQKFIQKLTN